MNKWFPLSVLCVVVALVCGGYSLVQAQTGDLKPTFLAPTPGLYVNGWPVLTVSYPKEWVIQPNLVGELFRASVPGQTFPPPLPELTISAQGNVGDVSGSSKRLMEFWAMMNFREVKLLSDKPTTLRDGTPAQEAEFEFVPSIPGGTKRNLFLLTVTDTGMEERDHTYLYDEYTFEFPSSTGGIFRALTYVVPGKEVAEKGLCGVAREVIAHVLEKYENEDKEKGVEEYLVSIVTYPFPEQNIESAIIEYDFIMKEVDELREFLSRQRRLDISL
jgi:hypothetical protein